MPRMSKAEMLEKFLELGGDRKEVPENLDDIKADDLQTLIDGQIEANKLKAQLGRAPTGPITSESTKPEGEKEQDLPKSQQPPKVQNEGVSTFTLTKAGSFSSARLPGKRYVAGQPVVVTDPFEADFLRKSGQFREE